MKHSKARWSPASLETYDPHLQNFFNPIEAPSLILWEAKWTGLSCSCQTHREQQQSSTAMWASFPPKKRCLVSYCFCPSHHDFFQWLQCLTPEWHSVCHPKRVTRGLADGQTGRSTAHLDSELELQSINAFYSYICSPEISLQHCTDALITSSFLMGRFVCTEFYLN